MSNDDGKPWGGDYDPNTTRAREGFVARITKMRDNPEEFFKNAVGTMNVNDVTEEDAPTPPSNGTGIVPAPTGKGVGHIPESIRREMAGGKPAVAKVCKECMKPGKVLGEDGLCGICRCYVKSPRVGGLQVDHFVGMMRALLRGE